MAVIAFIRRIAVSPRDHAHPAGRAALWVIVVLAMSLLAAPFIGDKGQAGFYFDPTQFSQPEGAQFGNTKRNQFRAPGNWNVDFSIFRAFPFGGAGRRLEFRTEFFNLFNHPLWGIPVADITSNNFGRVLTVGNDGRGNGSARDSGTGERQIRFGLRFQF